MLDFKTLATLVAIDSPTGYTQQACSYIFNLLQTYGYKPQYTNKGAVRCILSNEKKVQPRLAIAAHTDTLGAIVSSINGNGTLAFSLLGSPTLPSVESEYVRVHTLDGKTYTGTILLNNPSSHSNRRVHTAERTTETMHVRLDEIVKSKDDVKKLGIRNGDIICFDTKYQETPTGFIKSRFMDNKAGCFVLFEIARRLKEKGKSAPVEIFFSNYEEVGHGGTCGYSPSIEELLVIDMGTLGDGLEGDEFSCSICAKDSAGPYDYEFRKKLIQICEQNSIAHKIDIYPFYSSDGSAALLAGNEYRVALIGPGVAASHGMERAHNDGIEATIELCLKYIEQM